MKCDIIRDLLPLYIDGLTSEESNAEIKSHLAECEDCSVYYKEMQGDIQEEVPVINEKEIDYLKKVKRKNKKIILMWVGITAVVILVLVKMFVIGFEVKSTEMEMSHSFENGMLDIEFNLLNGHDLIMWGQRDVIYDENGKNIGYHNIKKPHWVFHNPFDDVGTRFSLGTSFDGFSDMDGDYTHRDIIKFKDKDIVFVNGQLVE